MGIKRILSGLLVVVMVLSMMTMNVFAADSDKVVLSDVPYDYGVVPFSKEWNELKLEEQKDIFSINKELAKSLTTEALLETILKNPYIIDLFVYEDFNKAIKDRDNQFQLLEFLSRPDARNVINDSIEKYSSSLIIFENKVNPKLELNKSMNYLSLEDIEIATDVVKYNFLKSILKYSLISEKQTLGVSRYDPGYVLTKGRVRVSCNIDYTWSDHGKTAIGANAEAVALRAYYSEAESVGSPNPSYNCHSYAWHENSTSNNKWINCGPMVTYLNEADFVSANNVQVGSKVTYFSIENSEYEHSAIVFQLNSDGTVKKVISKWGFYDLMVHPINYSPYTNTVISYWEY